MYCRHHQLHAGVLVLHATYAMTTQISINLIAMKMAYRRLYSLAGQPLRWRRNEAKGLACETKTIGVL